jgi:Family of unknown function (DUF695)
MFGTRRSGGDEGVQDAAWSMVETGKPDQPVFVRRNHALARIAGRKGFDQMVVAQLGLEFADARGMPTERDFPRLDQFEDSLAASLGATAFLALVITRAGGRRFVVYSADEPAVRAAVQAVGERMEIPDIGYGASPDPGWDFYRRFMGLR